MNDTENGLRRVFLLTLGALFVTGTLYADVTLVERAPGGKEKAQRARSHNLTGIETTGAVTLIDASNLEFFINTNITFTTSSSASGAASEASYTGPVSATTSLGGTVSATLDDAFDGYNALCVSTTGATGPCIIPALPNPPNPNYTSYNQNGLATLDATCSNRQVILPAKTIGTLSVQRKVFVPANDEFARWLSCVTNNGGSTAAVSLSTSNNLGSDGSTVIVNSSDGDATAELTDTWVSTFENYSGTTSTDPRLGHVLQGVGASVGLASINFVNGDDNPYWAYNLSLPAGATQCILNFVTGQESKAAANAKAAELVNLPANAVQCLSAAERSQVVNFPAQQSVVEIPTLNQAGLALLGLAVVVTALWLRRRQRANS